jgi:hypothetical protein
LNAAEEAGFELLLTTDRRIRHQQNLQVHRIALVVLTGSTRWSRVQHMSTASLPRCFRDPWQLLRGRDSLRAETRSGLNRERGPEGRQVGEIRILSAAVAAGSDRKVLTRRERMLVDQTGASWNRISDWLERLEPFRRKVPERKQPEL